MSNEDRVSSIEGSLHPAPFLAPRPSPLAPLFE